MAFVAGRCRTVTHRFRAWLGGAGVAFGFLLSAAPLHAYPELPQALAETFETACPVPCLQCHTSPAGGSDTVRPEKPGSPFGNGRGTGTFVQNLIFAVFNGGGKLTEVKGPSAEVLSKLLVLAKYDTAPCDGPGTVPCDSDGDGASDVAELGDGTDPDKAGPAGQGGCPKYGCGAHIAEPPARRALDGTALVAALAVALVLARRMRRAAT